MVIMYDGVNELIYQGVTYEEFLDTEHWVKVEGGGALSIPLPDGYEELINTANWAMVENLGG